MSSSQGCFDQTDQIGLASRTLHLNAQSLQRETPAGGRGINERPQHLLSDTEGASIAVPHLSFGCSPAKCFIIASWAPYHRQLGVRSRDAAVTQSNAAAAAFAWNTPVAAAAALIKGWKTFHGQSRSNDTSTKRKKEKEEKWIKVEQQMGL